MSTYIQWALYGKDASGKPLSEEKADELCEMLEEEVTEWHCCEPDDECIGQFLSTYNNGYSSVTEIVGDFAKTVPDFMFLLECHNEDEDWYQRILFRGDDYEVLEGHVVYDPPQRIFYDAPESAHQIMIVLQGGSVQGVFSDMISAADVTLVDLDLDKLDSEPEDERNDTLKWINEKLMQSGSMNTLYGRRIEEV